MQEWFEGQSVDWCQNVWQNAIDYSLMRNISNNNSAIPRLKKCPRCGVDNTPEKHRCTSCGYIIDERLLAETLKTQQSTIEGIVKRLENVEKLGEKIDLLFDELINQKSAYQKAEIS